MRPFILMCALVLSGCCAVGSARAAYNPVVEGSTQIAFSAPFLKALSDHGVRIQAKGGKRGPSGSVILRAEGGEVDPRRGIGTVDSSGTITFSAGARKVILRRIVFKAKRAPLYAKVGGGQLKLATGAKLRYARAGFGATFAATGLRLTSKVATRLNKKLRLGKALHAGELLGAVRVKTQPATVHLEQTGSLRLSIDPTFASKLDRHFVSLNPIAPAELAVGPTLSFPVGAESSLATDGSSGTVKLNGQAELLQLGSAQMFWRELWLQPAAAALLVETDVQPAPPHPGTAPQGPFFVLGSGGSVTVDGRSREISIAGRPVSLTKAAADLLNNAFADSEAPFSEGEIVGTMSLLARAA